MLILLEPRSSAHLRLLVLEQQVLVPARQPALIAYGSYADLETRVIRHLRRLHTACFDGEVLRTYIDDKPTSVTLVEPRHVRVGVSERLQLARLMLREAGA